MKNISVYAYTLAVIGAFLLIFGGVRLAASAQTRTRGMLMIVAAIVLIMNVMIWTV